MAIGPDGKIFSSGDKEMPKITREQIKEAFKKTIERWEKIVEEFSHSEFSTYFYKSECPLCGLEPPGCENKKCPIWKYTGVHSCLKTPYIKFDAEHTRENALAELNFLRKVYIWWIEKEQESEKVFEAVKEKEEKKEEWVDITNNISWVTVDYSLSIGLSYLLYGADLTREKVVFVNEEGIQVCHEHEKRYIVEQKGQTFRILKKAK